MKAIKTIGLAALPALMAMALIGASSAMAEFTQLCKKEEEKCEASPVKPIHYATLSGAKAKILTDGLGTVECDVLFLGSVLPLASTQSVHGNFTYSNCAGLIGICTAKEGAQNTSLLEYLRLDHEFADVTYNYSVTFECLLFKCTYEGDDLRGYASGPLLSNETNGGTEIEKQRMRRVGTSGCPEEAELDLLMTPLEKVYISR